MHYHMCSYESLMLKSCNGTIIYPRCGCFCGVFSGSWERWFFFHGFICTFAVYRLGSHREKYREKHLGMRGVHVILKNWANSRVDEFAVYKRKYKILYIKCRVFFEQRLHASLGSGRFICFKPERKSIGTYTICKQRGDTIKLTVYKHSISNWY